MGVDVLEPVAARTTARVLLVENDPQRARQLAEQLGPRGYDVARVDCEETAFERLERERFGIVICSDGDRLLRRVCDDDDHAYLILLAEGAGPRDVELALESGADDVLPGPLDPARLLGRLRVAERFVRLQDHVRSRNRALLDTNRRLEETNDRMVRELRTAAGVQQALLPAPTFQCPGVSVGWRLRPCDELAGDLLNCMRLDEHHLAFYVLDVSGHGVSSALLSVQVSRLMSPLLSESELLKARLTEPPWYRVVEPATVVSRLNSLFQTDVHMTQYFTIVYGTLHVASGQLKFAAAGHPGPILSRASGETRVLRCESHPVGFFEDPVIQSHELTLEAGDRIWLYSDGIVEAANGEGSEFGGQRLIDSVRAGAELPIKDSVDATMRDVEAWRAGEAAGDDCTLLAVERG